MKLLEDVAIIAVYASPLAVLVMAARWRVVGWALLALSAALPVLASFIEEPAGEIALAGAGMGLFLGLVAGVVYGVAAAIGLFVGDRRGRRRKRRNAVSRLPQARVVDRAPD
jgi:hypothetical protein